MGWLETVLSGVAEATAEEKAKLARIAFRLVVAVHIMWVCGLLQPLGLEGVVFAHDVEPKVQEHLTPIRTEISAISTKVRGIEDKLDYTNELVIEVLVGNMANQLRDLNRLRCTTTDDHVRMRMERDIEDGQRKYMELTSHGTPGAGERYPLPACKDL